MARVPVPASVLMVMNISLPTAPVVFTSDPRLQGTTKCFPFFFAMVSI